MEAENIDDLHTWTANWSDLADFEITPVRTSQEAQAVIAPQL
jgi:hypothetical protein